MTENQDVFEYSGTADLVLTLIALQEARVPIHLFGKALQACKKLFPEDLKYIDFRKEGDSLTSNFLENTFFAIGAWDSSVTNGESIGMSQFQASQQIASFEQRFGKTELEHVKNIAEKFRENLNL